MNQKPTYPNIDMQQTGKRLKCMIESAGYTPRIIQEHLHLSCVQPIYRWYKGKILPSVDHLLMLSELLNVHMDDLLVLQGESVIYSMIELSDDPTTKRLLAYAKYLRKAA